MVASIIFDFDGTLAVGHGPVLAYAQTVSAFAQEGFVNRVENALQQYDTGESTYRDGYDIVGSLAALDGVSAKSLQSSYSLSRELLGTATAPVDTMPGLSEFLSTLRQSVRVVLATNAPERGITQILNSWGVTHKFDELHFDVGKPVGLTPIVSRLRVDGPVLSIGDIPEFDLAPAQDLGADTALVGASATTSDFPATFRGPSLSALRSVIETWAASTASSTPAPSGASPKTER